MHEIIRQTDVKSTRKVCVCSGCSRQMPVGSSVLKVFFRDCGEIQESVWCRVCELYGQEMNLRAEDYESMSLGDFKACDGEFWNLLRIQVEAPETLKEQMPAKER